jgi:beta-lactamase superfamily II metal-dependent hydrolase
VASATVHIFNVEHGDSSLVEISPDGEPSRWVLIDCNTVRRDGTVVCPAHEFLKTKNVRVLDLVVVTHLHADHYNGIDAILANYEVRKIAVPPFISERSAVYRKTIFQKYRKKILETADRTGDTPVVNAQLISLASLLSFLKDHWEKVQEVFGPQSTLLVPDAKGLQFSVQLPLRKCKGVLIERIENDQFELDYFPEMNDSSVVVTLEVHGTRIAWMADSTLGQWQEHRRQMNRDGVTCLDVDIAKIPHHGSRENNKEWLYQYVMRRSSTNQTVVVSANGLSHPHDEFFQIVAGLQLAPYCTNLAAQCTETDIFSIEGLAHVPAAMRPFLVNYGSHRRSVPCQGDVTIRVTADGADLSSSTGAPCVYAPGVLRSRSGVT